MRAVGWCVSRFAMAGLLAICCVLGCGRVAASLPAAFRYFEAPAADDPWSGKIARWQAREREQAGADLDASGLSTVAAGPDRVVASGESLHEKYLRFRAEHRRSLARGVATWLQEQSKLHYVPDGVLDRWATFAETLARNGDDCDGLELLAYHLLLDLGFRGDEVYRAIVLRPADGQHHMVTLWFEDAEDPWVLDPTGAMTPGMPRLSEVPGWIPLKVFSPEVEYTAAVPAAARARAAAVPLPPPR